jgi:hypothetical protein
MPPAHDYASVTHGSVVLFVQLASEAGGELDVGKARDVQAYARRVRDLSPGACVRQGPLPRLAACMWCTADTQQRVQKVSAAWCLCG